MMADEAENRGGSLEGGAGPAEELKGLEEEPAGALGVVAASLAPPPAGEAAPSSEETECPVCSNCFDGERHAPKLLECLHTFCRECLRQLHLRAAHPLYKQVRFREGPDCGDPQGGAAAISCPLCRHLTELPDGRVHNLPVNTRLAKTLSLPPDHLQPLLPWQAPESPRLRPLLDGATAASVLRGAEERPSSSSDLCKPWLMSTWGKVGCFLIFVVLLSVLAAILLSMVKCKWVFCEAVVSMPFFLLLFLVCFLGSCLIICASTNRCKRPARAAEQRDSPGQPQLIMLSSLEAR